MEELLLPILHLSFRVNFCFRSLDELPHKLSLNYLIFKELLIHLTDRFRSQ